LVQLPFPIDSILFSLCSATFPWHFLILSPRLLAAWQRQAIPLPPSVVIYMFQSGLGSYLGARWLLSGRVLDVLATLCFAFVHFWVNMLSSTFCCCPRRHRLLARERTKGRAESR